MRSPARRRSLPASAPELSELFATAPVGVIGLSLDGTILWVNRVELDRLGYDEADLVGRALGDLRADGVAMGPLLERIAAGGALDRHAAALRAKDGSIRHAVVGARLVHREPTSFVACFLVDVPEEHADEGGPSSTRRSRAAAAPSSQRKRARTPSVTRSRRIARALSKAAHARRRLEAVLRQMPAALSLFDADGRLELVNEQHAAIFRTGATSAALADDDRHFVAHGLDGRLLGADEWPVARAIHRGETIRGEDVRILRGDGTPSVVRVHAGPIRDERGSAVGTVAIYEDVTDSAEDRLLFLSEASRLLGASIDFDDTLRSICALAVPLLADWCAIEIVHPDGAHEQLAVEHVDVDKIAYATELRRRYPPEVERDSAILRVIRTGATEMYPEITDGMLAEDAIDDEHRRMLLELGLRSVLIVPIKSRARVFGAITLVTAESGRRFDDSDKQLAEELAARASLALENATLYAEAQRAIQQREDFLSVASHELRTPIAALDLQIATLLRGIAVGRESATDPAKLRERLGRAHAQVGRLTRLVTELLDVSRIHAGRLVLQLDAVDLADLAREVCQRFEEQAGRAGSTLTIRAAPELVGRWDRNRLDQVLTNLVSNALKYGAGKPVLVRVERSGEGARLCVEDHGLGIAAADQPRIFERFERTVTTKHYSGIGLGLWITREIVEAHGGSIAVESTLGHGSTFTVELPLAAPEPSAPVTSS